MQRHLKFALLAVYFTAPSWSDVEEPVQDCLMLLDSSNNSRSVIVMDHQEAIPVKANDNGKQIQNVRTRHVQIWHSLPVGAMAEPNDGKPAVEGSEEAFLTPDVDKTIEILDPSAYLGIVPGQEGFGAPEVPSEVVCQDVAQKGAASSMVSPVFMEPEAPTKKLTTLVSLNH